MKIGDEYVLLYGKHAIGIYVPMYANIADIVAGRQELEIRNGAIGKIISAPFTAPSRIREPIVFVSFYSNNRIIAIAKTRFLMPRTCFIKKMSALPLTDPSMGYAVPI